MVESDSGAMKRHPAVLVARDAFSDFRAAVAQLSLEAELEDEIGEQYVDTA